MSPPILQLRPYSPSVTLPGHISSDDGSVQKPGVDETIRPVDDDKQYKLHRRFDRLGRLLGDNAVARLMNARVAVFGLGGVGGFAAEALARSAIGHLTLVDFDKVCVTNTNRQLQAMKGTVGKPKADILRDRLALVNPDADVVAIEDFYDENNSEKMLVSDDGIPFDYVVDCIDNMTAKAHLLATCVAKGIPVVSSMGAAGKLDPTRIHVRDLGETEVCRLARDLRKILRRNHELPRTGKMGIQAVYSDENRSWPKELSYDGGKGFRCVCPHKDPRHGCDSRNLIDGTVSYVTGTFGLVCASVVVNQLSRVHEERPNEERAHEPRNASTTPM